MLHSDLYPYLENPPSSVSAPSILTGEEDKIRQWYPNMYPIRVSVSLSWNPPFLLYLPHQFLLGRRIKSEENLLQIASTSSLLLGIPHVTSLRGQIFSLDIVLKYHFQMSSSNIIVEDSHKIKYPPQLSLSSLNLCLVPLFGFFPGVSPLRSITHKPTHQSWNICVKLPGKISKSKSIVKSYHQQSLYS